LPPLARAVAGYGLQEGRRLLVLVQVQEQVQEQVLCFGWGFLGPSLGLGGPLVRPFEGFRKALGHEEVHARSRASAGGRRVDGQP